MGIVRSTYEFLKQASIAHAKWDYEVSMSIIHNRKKMWILLLLLLPQREQSLKSELESSHD